jgi:hypothetical protein
MATFDFSPDAGVELDVETTIGSARAIQQRIEDVIPGQITDLLVMDDGDEVTVIGEAPTEEARETAILLAGNVKGIAHVNDDALMITDTDEKPEPAFRTVEPGETLERISEEVYGDAGNAIQIRQANAFLLDDGEAHPGLTIRLP